VSNRANPTVIGGFVVGAVVLIASAFAIFGGSQIFTEKMRYVSLFDEPTNGLRAGANVLLNGVRIGYVSDIDLLIDQDNFSTLTQVTLEIHPDNYVMTRSGKAIGSDLSDLVDHDVLINQAGMRATLQVESFVTGQLQIELQLRPGTDPMMRGVDPPYPEIPTITSNIQELLEKVQMWFADVRENVDLGALSKRLDSVLQGMDELVNSREVRESLAGLNTIINDPETQKLASSVQQALDELRAASSRAEQMFASIDSGVADVVTEMQSIMTQLGGALDEAEQTLAAAKMQLRGDSEQLYQLQLTLDELQRAARSVNDFFDYLERNPESLLKGKPK